MDVRPSITVNLDEYGMNGDIVLEPMTFRRDMEFKNNISSAIKYEGVGQDVRIVGQDAGTIRVYTVLAYMTKAPFPLTFDGFMNFMDRCDARELGLGEKVFDRLMGEVGRIRNGELSPFGRSEASPTGTSESS